MLLTIFTPTYNRQNQLLRLYESLKKQDNRDFEWLIIDDGSKDDTALLVESFIEEQKISIRYVKQKNSGKHVAYNTALKYSKGKFFFCIDSDDWMEDDFISSFVDKIEDLDANGFIAYKKNSYGKLLSEKFPSEIEESSLFDLQETYGCIGEFSIIIKNDIAKEYRFPVFEGEKFVTESVIYDQIGKKYKFRLLNQVATVCEYQEDGLTANCNLLMKYNPTGFCLYFMQRVDLVHGFVQKICMAGKYHCFRSLSKKDKLKYMGKNKILVFLTKPLGSVFLLYYKLIRGF
ncbi:MAG: glycosyltransferase family A protein [Peptoniphilus sp.]|nr:glycosyltransferase family A protein [Peptoniphilus sp.]